MRGPNQELLGGVVVCRDITQSKEEEFFRAGQSRVLEMIAADAPLADILTSLVLLMEGQAEGLRCSILLLNRDGKRVRHGERWIELGGPLEERQRRRPLRQVQLTTRAVGFDCRNRPAGQGA